MYTLYFFQGACSLATQVVLRELNQTVTLIDINQIDSFTDINEVATVPVLIDGERTLTEGAAIMLYVLDKHNNAMLPREGQERTQAIQDIMFANATMHPAYSRLFFAEKNMTDEQAKLALFDAASETINQLWRVVENKLATQPFLGGQQPSAADILLTVYSAWGDFFPIDVVFGLRTLNMLQSVKAMPSFQLSVEAEQAIVSSQLSV